MNLKIIKQTLAAVIAVASFATTPGLAEASLSRRHVAAKKKRHKFITLGRESKTVAGSEEAGQRKHPAVVKKKHHKFITLGNENKKVSELANQLFETLGKESKLKNDIINIINNLNKKENLYAQKSSIAKFISDRVSARKDPYIAQFKQVVKLLAKCADDKEAGRFVASCFDFIAFEQFKVDLDFESVEKILKSLYKHDDSEDLLISVIDGACFNDFFKNASQDKINEILDLFLKYSNFNQPTDSFFESLQSSQTENAEKKYMSPQKHMVQVIAKLNCDGCFKNCTQSQISDILDIFSNYFSFPFVVKDAIDVINNLIINGCFENCSQDSIIKLKNLLLKCPEYQDYEQDIITITKNLIVNDCFKNCSQEVVSEIINISLEFLNSQDNAEYFAYIMESSLNQGFLNKYPQADLLKIEDNLADWLENERIQKYWTSIILNLFNQGFFEKCQKNDVSKIIDGLAKCSANEKLRQNCAVLISNFADCGFFKNCDKDDILQIKSILTNCVNDENSKKYVANVVKILLDWGFCQSEKSEISQMINLLYTCSSNQDAESYILDSVNILLNKEWFIIYSDNKFSNMQDEIFLVSDLLQKYYSKYEKKDFSLENNTLYEMPIETYDDQDPDVLSYIKRLSDDLDRQSTNLQHNMFDEN